MMNPKFLFILTLVLSGGLLGCSHSTRQSTPNVVFQESNPPPFIALAGEFKHPGQIPWTNGMTLKDAIIIGELTDFARHQIEIRHEDGTRVRYKWSPQQSLPTNNPVLKPGDTVVSPEVFF